MRRNSSIQDTVASLHETCCCQTCEKVCSFTADSQKLALLVSCSRKDRHNVHRCLAGQADTIHKENHGQGLMIKKTREHPHSRCHENYFAVMGEQVVEQSSVGSHFVPMSGGGADGGIVSKKAKDVIKNQTNDVVVRGLWVHYSAKNLGLLGTTVNERFHKFANAKLKGIRIVGWDLFCLYIMWLIEDWNQLHASSSWVTQLPDDIQNPFPDALEEQLLQLDLNFDSICMGQAPYECVRFIPSSKKVAYTPEGLVAAGIPVNLDKFHWTAKAIAELKAIVKELNENRTNRPPTKSVFKFIKGNICGGCGPSEDQIRRKLHTITYFTY